MKRKTILSHKDGQRTIIWFNTCHFFHLNSVKVFTFQVIEPSLKKTKIYIQKLKYLPVLTF